MEYIVFVCLIPVALCFILLVFTIMLGIVELIYRNIPLKHAPTNKFLRYLWEDK